MQRVHIVMFMATAACIYVVHADPVLAQESTVATVHAVTAAPAGSPTGPVTARDPAWRYAHGSVSLFGSTSIETMGSGSSSVTSAGVSASPRFVLPNGLVLQARLGFTGAIGQVVGVTPGGLSGSNTSAYWLNGGVGIGYAVRVAANADVSGSVNQYALSGTENVWVNTGIRLALPVILSRHFLFEPSVDAGVTLNPRSTVAAPILASTWMVTAVSLGYRF